MTPEERRTALLTAVVTTVDFSPEDTVAAHVVDKLLAYFDENEPAIADAIRYGLKEVIPVGDYGNEVRITKPERHHPIDQDVYRQDYGGALYQVDRPLTNDSSKNP